MRTHIPNYRLYGDAAEPDWLGMVHFEWIRERSSLFHFEIAPHVHDGLIQVLYLTQGGGEATIEGQRWALPPQALIVVPSGHVHAFHFTPDVDGPVVTAAQAPLESLAGVGDAPLLAQVRRPLVMSAAGTGRQARALRALFDAIAAETRLQAHEPFAAGPALLLAVFVQIARIAASFAGERDVRKDSDAATPSRRSAQLERFRALVDEHFPERWPIERYAGELGVSAGQLSRLCREALGHSALDVVNARVLHEARRELVYSNLSVKQIAALLGFADDAYFGRFFRKQAGETPTAFRDAARRKLGRSVPAPGLNRAA
jgi:AraC family transcriptional activator of pobA